MRFYGIRSGRNNMSGLIARSIMFNSSKKNYNAVKTNNEELSILIAIAFIVIIYLIIL